MPPAAAAAKPKSSLRSEAKAGLVFPVNRMRKHLKTGRGSVGRRVNTEAAVYLTAAIEWVAARALHAAALKGMNSTRYTDKKTGVWKVMVPHLKLALAADRELAGALSVPHLVRSR